MHALAETSLPLERIAQGKVRDLYDVGQDRLLLVASDRVSAFDVVLEQAIPCKGAVLTQITAFWLERLAAAEPNHLITARPAHILRAVPALGDVDRAQWAGRAMLVKRAEPFPIECVVRGYISGSAWKEYLESGTLAGEPLPRGLVESQRLETPIFSPATKAEHGLHDENITLQTVQRRLGSAVAEELRTRALELYEEGRTHAAGAGIIIADTKFEFGTLGDGTIALIDEVLTPDSSRFWPESEYGVGRGQPSLDKQPLRDWLERECAAGRWDRTPPAPALPPEIGEAMSQRYLAVFERLTGMTLDDWLEGPAS
ncbi:MAG: phosphoribosylaminoimidazolesuccinocarboxamide synthase [Longimicrobiales bacterium]